MSTEMDMSALGAMNAVLHMAIENYVGQESLSWTTLMNIANATLQFTSLFQRKSWINWGLLTNSSRIMFKEELKMVLEEVEAEAVA